MGDLIRKYLMMSEEVEGDLEKMSKRLNVHQNSYINMAIFEKLERDKKRFKTIEGNNGSEE